MLSVIVPIFNAQKYLADCLDSLHLQKLQAVEFILIDDGSTDQSITIAKEYLQKDHRFRLIHKANEGYGTTCNRGLNEAKGDYIGIVEPDDWIDVDMFSSLYLKTVDSIDVIFCGFQKHFPSQAVVKKTYALKSEFQLDFQSLCHILYQENPATWAKIYRKEFLLKNNIRWMETPGASFQDLGFFIESMFQADSFYYIHHTFYHYRMHAQQSVNNSNNHFAFTRVLEYLFHQRLFLSNLSFEKKQVLWKVIVQHWKMNLERVSDISLKKELFHQIQSLDFSFFEKAEINNNKGIFSREEISLFQAIRAKDTIALEKWMNSNDFFCVKLTKKLKKFLIKALTIYPLLGKLYNCLTKRT